MFPSIDHAYVRLLWGVVETHSALLHGLSDEAMGYWVFKNVQDRLYLSAEEALDIQQYIFERIHLIRDMAEHALTSDR